jgi:anti-anti-sigma factor
MDKITGLLTIAGTLDIDAASSLREALLECLAHEMGEVSADLSEVDGCDAAALQVLLAGRKDAAAIGKVFRVIAPSNAVAQTAAALGLSFDQPGDLPSKEPQIAT